VETAVREAQEEASLKLDADTLVPFSRWITPRQVKVRFDTHFFVARTPDDAEPRCDGEECVDLRWIGPADALEAGKRDELSLVFPTIKHLEQLTEFGSVDELLDHARSRRVQPVEPRVLVDGGVAQVLLPGEPGYEDV
jgi:8-oxo-dGTP pyrophosphatase MutT (NUDIX family)